MEMIIFNADTSRGAEISFRNLRGAISDAQCRFALCGIDNSNVNTAYRA